jgi:hypothetical protein
LGEYGTYPVYVSSTLGDESPGYIAEAYTTRFSVPFEDVVSVEEETAPGGAITFGVHSTSGHLVISTAALGTNLMARVFDVSGRQVAAARLSPQTGTATIKDLVSGVYFVRLEDGSHAITRRAIMVR